MQQIAIDWDGLLNMMNTELPKIPAPPEVEEINPPHEELKIEFVGKLKPKDKNEKEKKKKGVKKAQPKKDEKPQKEV